MLRIFCHADHTAAGELALAYVNAIRDNGRAFSYVLVSLVPADLMPPTDPATGKPTPKAPGWHHHAERFRVDLKAPWTNVVMTPCDARMDWAVLHTAKVRNVLFAGDNDPSDKAARYDMIAVPSPEAYERWSNWSIDNSGPAGDDGWLRVVRPDDARALAELLDV